MAEFEEDMQGVRLENAKVYYLQHDNQFYTKYFLERVDTATNYLIYAPFPKPETADNHLEDTLLYSKRFFADRAALLLADLGIDEKYRPLIEKHIKFWAEKKRAQRFYDLEIENYNETNILVGIMAALCFARTCSYEDVVRVVLTGGGLAGTVYAARSHSGVVILDSENYEVSLETTAAIPETFMADEIFETSEENSIPPSGWQQLSARSVTSVETEDTVIPALQMGNGDRELLLFREKCQCRECDTGKWRYL